MHWRVRAHLQDRPGAMAALAVQCGDQGINILGLQIFPTTDGVIDELVLRTPSEWTAHDVEQLLTRAGASDPQVAVCTPHALQDQAVRYARAARTVMEDPESLEDQLCRLLDATPHDGSPAMDALILDDGDGPFVSLHCRVPFTDTEHARAAALREVAAANTVVLARKPPTAPDDSVPPLVRPGSVDDAGRLVAMHARCSSESIRRRYHASMPYLPQRLARALMQPAHGWSVVMSSGEHLIGVAMLARDRDGTADVGLLVEDRWQRRGIGARLLRVMASQAAQQGLTTLTCVAQPDNRAVLATIRRAGLHAHITMDDGLLNATIPIAEVVETPREPREVMEVSAHRVGGAPRRAGRPQDL